MPAASVAIIQSSRSLRWTASNPDVARIAEFINVTGEYAIDAAETFKLSQVASKYRT
jgi:hypothetical protein